MTPDLTLDEMEALARERSGPELLAMGRRVERIGGCERPIRVRALGSGSPSAQEPDGVLLVACKTRRETRCRPCADMYRGDARQLIRAGIEGGKGVPESVARHPAVFVTLTAPSFGAVHRAIGGPCHIGRAGRCAHGRPLYCLQRHDEHEEVVGSALCPRCYDFEAAVVFNATAGELWRRVTIYARRHLAYVLQMTERELARLVRLSYLKVAELQRRGVVHLHALVRVDAVADELAPPGITITSDLLAEALVRAVRAVHVERVVLGEVLTVAFGEQLKVERLDSSNVASIASYLAKYLSKSASDSGALDHRLREGELEHVELPEHLRAIVATAWRLGGEAELRRLRHWSHALGYSGHLMTKSRRYSTTFGDLRAARQRWRIASDETSEPSVPSTTRRWTFEGVGFRRRIDVVLAATVAEGRRRARAEGWDDRLQREERVSDDSA